MDGCGDACFHRQRQSPGGPAWIVVRLKLQAAAQAGSKEKYDEWKEPSGTHGRTARLRERPEALGKKGGQWTASSASGLAHTRLLNPAAGTRL